MISFRVWRAICPSEESQWEFCSFWLGKHRFCCWFWAASCSQGGQKCPKCGRWSCTSSSSSGGELWSETPLYQVGPFSALWSGLYLCVLSVPPGTPGIRKCSIFPVIGFVYFGFPWQIQRRSWGICQVSRRGSVLGRGNPSSLSK